MFKNLQLNREAKIMIALVVVLVGLIIWGSFSRHQNRINPKELEITDQYAVSQVRRGVYSVDVFAKDVNQKTVEDQLRSKYGDDAKFIFNYFGASLGKPPVTEPPALTKEEIDEYNKRFTPEGQKEIVDKSYAE